METIIRKYIYLEPEMFSEVVKMLIQYFDELEPQSPNDKAMLFFYTYVIPEAKELLRKRKSYRKKGK